MAVHLHKKPSLQPDAIVLMMPAPLGLERRVRAHSEASEDEIPASDTGSEASLASDESPHSSEDDSDAEMDEDSELNQQDETDAKPDFGSISFGALAKAQAALSKGARGKGPQSDLGQSGTLDTLRQQLRDAKAYKGGTDGKNAEKKKGLGLRDLGRSSKHAPTEMSSKKAVSRKREVVPTVKRTARDPRFETLTGALNETRVKQNYSFLDDYRQDEMRLLREEIKKTKSEDQKEKLKRALVSMESKKKAREAKEKEQEIIREHKKKERDLIKQGKKPYYLKKSEQKRLALVERYGHLKDGQLERAMERRRKKQAAKERSRMPDARRNTGEQGT